MYCLSDKQIDFIFNDICARGVEMESLQQNLLDHICCIIEQNLEDEKDFELFYNQTIKTFYKHELWEIEEETIQLLTFKNYYAMKKIMLVTGTLSVSFLAQGLIFKFMHWPGAAMGILLGLVMMSLVFLPLLFVLKIKEKQQTKEKLTIAFGTLAGILITLGTLFKIMHWPYANMMITGSMGVTMLLFLPMYFFSGIRNAETKVNTIVSSILIVSACGLLLVLMRTPRSSHMREKMMTESYLRSQSILQAEQAELVKKIKSDSLQINQIGNEIVDLSEKLKLQIVETETGSKNLIDDFYKNDMVITDHVISDVFLGGALDKEVETILNLLKKYESKNADNLKQEDSKGNLNELMFFNFYRRQDMSAVTTFEVLNQLTQLQMILIQAEFK